MARKSHQQRIERQRLARQAARRAEQEQRRRQLVVISAALSVLLVVGVVVLLAVKGTGSPSSADTPSPAPTSATVPPNTPSAIPTALADAPKRATPLPAQMSCSYLVSKEKAAKSVDAPKAGKVSARGTAPVTLSTSIGDLHLTLDRSLAPCAVNSFLSLTRQKYFDNTKCHRLTTGAGLQVLQCGDPSGTGSGGPGYSFADEVFPTLKYGRGTLAMANSGKDTNGSQFFIVYGDGSGLTPNYTAFGTVDTVSLAAIDAVARKGVTPVMGPGDGTPITPVEIKTATTTAD